jgi:small GTP-binding protein
MNDKIRPGFTLRHTLRGHEEKIMRIAWSPDGNILASPSYDHIVRLWDVQTGQHLKTLAGHSNSVISVAWSPDGRVLASGSFDGTIRLWDTRTGQLQQALTAHSEYIYGVAWSPDGRFLASCSYDNTIRIWDAQTRKRLQTLLGHSNYVNNIVWSPNGHFLASSSHDSTIRLWDAQTGQHLRTLAGHDWHVISIAWSPNGEVLASASYDMTIRLWDTRTGQQLDIIEGHTSIVTCVSPSVDGRFLASKSDDGTVRIWRTDTWETVAILEEPASGYWASSLAFHPSAPILGTLGEMDMVIHIWELDIATVLRNVPVTPSIRYTNAKVVLVGDSGVGKSGLGLALTGQPFAPTESTHGRHVWPFDSQEVKRYVKVRETRETLLWDLAGQTGYRIIHQLHLNEVAVALLVFDAHSETNPLAGVDHWVRALRMAQRAQGSSALPMKKFLVAARIDRGGKKISHERIDALMQELGFDEYFETSAKEGMNIALLTESIKDAIDWEILPKVTSTDLFQHIKAFLVAEKGTGRSLSTIDDLYHLFLRSKDAPSETEELRAQFETCIRLVESKGLIQQLSFGNLVLLQPELLDAYASALINAVRDEPDGLGSISEEKVKAGEFFIPKGERIADREQEKLLLIAMVEDLLRYEIALREQGDDGAYLIFPSQSTRENPDLPDPEGKAVIFGFEGPVQNIYASLAVRLSHSGLFTRKELWKNAVTYTTKVGGTYGMFLHNLGEGRAELILFFDQTAREETCFHFEEYVKTHLQRRALAETLKRRRIFVCPQCGTPLHDLHVTKRRSRHFDWILCNVCDTKVSLLDREERLAVAPSPRFLEMDQAADSQRDREVAKSTVQGKVATGDFDVFLCHNGKDKPEVKKVGEQLKEHGILPWLDEWELRPGLPWQRLLEEQIGQIKSAAVFIGKDGIGPWEQMELEAFLREFVNRGVPVIPVILANAPKEPKLPIFLRSMTWVDFRKKEPDSLKRLIWGITGEREHD